jgi:hypothetical protein
MGGQGMHKVETLGKSPIETIEKEINGRIKMDLRNGL